MDYVKMDYVPNNSLGPVLFLFVAARVPLCDHRVELLLLFGAEQSAYADARLLPQQVVARSHLCAQLPILAARLVHNRAYLRSLLVVQVQVAPQGFKKIFFARLSLPALAGSLQAIDAVERRARHAAEHEDTHD